MLSTYYPFLLLAGGYSSVLVYLLRILWSSNKIRHTWNSGDDSRKSDETHDPAESHRALLSSHQDNYGTNSSKQDKNGLIEMGSDPLHASAVSSDFGYMGESTRLLFYQCMLISVLLRLISLPIQAYYYSQWNNIDGSYVYVSNRTGLCTQSFIFITTIALPEWSFLTAYMVLIIFFVQLTCVVTVGPSSDVLSYRVLKTLLSYLSSLRTVFTVMILFLSMTVLLMGILYITFEPMYPKIIYSMTCVLYFTLFVLLMTGYIGPILLFRVIRRHRMLVLDGLSVRLFGLCLLSSLMFLLKGLSYASQMSDTLSIQNVGNFIHRLSLNSLIELLPMFSVFTMMHKQSNSPR